MEPRACENREARMPFAHKARLRARLYRTLAEVFGYPTAERCGVLVSEPYLEELLDEARAARIQIDQVASDIAKWPAAQDTAMQAEGLGTWGEGRQPEPPAGRKEGASALPGRSFRAECTRLFYSHPRPIRLEGRAWVPLRGRAESVAVGRLYRELSLRNKQGVNEPPDNLASELDYASYVLDAEAAAWEGADSANALEWRALYSRFLESHLGPFAQGVAGAILECTTNGALRFYAALLQAVTMRE